MDDVQKVFGRVYEKFRKPDCTGLPYAFGAVNMIVNGRVFEVVIKEYTEGDTPTEFKVVIDGKTLSVFHGEFEFYSNLSSLLVETGLDEADFIEALEFLA
ncbi:MAG: hypothetical protein ACNI27_06070 [Desulfovibrio sp.]